MLRLHHLGKRQDLTPLLRFSLAGSIGEEIQLEGAARLRFGFAHAAIVASTGGASGREVFRGSLQLCIQRNIIPIRIT
ncbi:hypothetical protein A1D30_11680 [Acidovorax sp. GW101-3H11]|nr:hypothetical protein A1D30_11680 [Acidovorax sp. GW101-3H11]